MTDLGITPQEQTGVIKVLAAILHIGNIAFEGGETARVANRRPMQFAAELMGCDARELEKVTTQFACADYYCATRFIFFFFPCYTDYAIAFFFCFVSQNAILSLS